MKGDAAGEKFLATRYRETPLAGVTPHVEYVPPGITSPEPYVEGSARPPTPRQLRYFLREHGTDKTLTVFKRFRKEASTEPIFHPIFGFALVVDLLEQGKTRDAIAVRDYYRESGVDCDKILLAWGKMYLGLGRKKLAGEQFKKALLLDPSNCEAADKLKEIGGSETKSDGH